MKKEYKEPQAYLIILDTDDCCLIFSKTDNENAAGDNSTSHDNPGMGEGDDTPTEGDAKHISWFDDSSSNW